MRKAAVYPEPKYRDPNDKRLIQVLKSSAVARPGAVNIVGIPFDGAVLGRRGAAGGPSAIREAMAGFSNYNVELGVGLSDARIYDLGDLVLRGEDVLQAHRSVEEEIAEDLLDESLLLVLGGDNSISLPSIRACARKFGALGLVVIDTHLDLRGKIDGKPTSGSSYGLALETSRGLRPGRVVEIGTHGFANSEVYVKKARKLGISLITADEVRRVGASSVAKKASASAGRGAEAIYVSVDLDAVDIGEVSGVSAPSAGGISSVELLELVFRLASDTKVKCLDMVELAPNLDATGRSQRIAAAALVSAMAGFQTRTKHHVE